jgi:epoxyqueuosine reductase
MKLQARDDLKAPPLAELLKLDEAGFRKLFSGSPVKRLGHARFLRNVLIAAGNSGDLSLVPAIEARLADPAPLIRGAAVWALHRLDAERARHRSLAFSADERDGEVRAEWQLASTLV